MNPRRSLLPALALALVACEEKKQETIVAPRDPAPTALSTAPPATASAPTPASPAEAISATATATASGAPTAAAHVADAGKARASASGSASPAAPKPVTRTITGNNFALDVASPGCRAGEDCAMTIKLAATGDYHVNKEYPYKFVATPAAGVTFLGKTDPNTFSRQAGDFVEQGEKAAVLTVRFKPAAAGEAKVSGKYKLSVCSAANCQIEEQLIDLAVPVM